MTETELKKMAGLERSLRRTKQCLSDYKKAMAQLSYYIGAIDIRILYIQHYLERVQDKSIIDRYELHLKWLEQEKKDLAAIYEQRKGN